MKVDIRALEEFVLEDRSFDLGFARHYEALRASVAGIGVLQPLVARERPTGASGGETHVPGARFQIVCGFGRARVARDLKIARLPVHVLAPETSDGDCLRLSLFDNLGHRCFNPIERAIVLAKLVPHTRRERLIGDYMPLVGLQPSALLLDRTLALVDLIDPLRLAVALERIEQGVAVRLATLARDDQEALAHLLERCRPSVSVIRELAELLMDLARRDGRAITAILVSPEVATILESNELSPSGRTAALRRHLHQRRHPTVSRHEAAFAEARRALRLPPSMGLESAPDFESDVLRVEIRFASEEELRRSVATMARWFDDPSLLARLWPARSERSQPLPRRADGEPTI